VNRPIRSVLAVIAAVQAILAVLWAFQVPLAVDLWPFPGRSPLSNLFIASIFLAAAASTAWCLWVRSDRALAGVALDYIAILVPFAAFSFLQVAGGADQQVAVFAVVCVVGALVGVGLLRWSIGRPWRSSTPLPRPVRWAFIVFVIALVVVGGRLVIQAPQTLPWEITPELSTLFGFMFIGAAAYFAYGLLDQRWENAGGQLAGFLAYDVVLIVPFIVRLPTIEAALLPHLAIYTAIVALSGILAIYYLVIHVETRIWPRPPADVPGA